MFLKESFLCLFLVIADASAQSCCPTKKVSGNHQVKITKSSKQKVINTMHICPLPQIYKYIQNQNLHPIWSVGTINQSNSNLWDDFLMFMFMFAKFSLNLIYNRNLLFFYKNWICDKLINLTIVIIRLYQVLTPWPGHTTCLMEVRIFSLSVCK